ncbi:MULTISPECIES: lipase family protein [Nocardiopsis]|nr:hypothetical protein [Nocardiopsis sp. BMP B8015]
MPRPGATSKEPSRARRGARADRPPRGGPGRLGRTWIRRPSRAGEGRATGPGAFGRMTRSRTRHSCGPPRLPGSRHGAAHQRSGTWFTGHSLGGAPTMPAAARVYFSGGLHTLGKPRTGDSTLAEAYGGRTSRFVNDDDTVAQVPPEPFYRHIPEVRHIDAEGRPHEERMPLPGGLTDSFQGRTADLPSPGADGVRDHSTDSYAAHLDDAASRGPRVLRH